MKRIKVDSNDIFEKIFIKNGRLNIGLISTLMLVLVICLSIGYSAFSSNLNISGIVTNVIIKKDVRVTGVSGTKSSIKCSVVSGTGTQVGDEISCAGENFYIISYEEHKIKAIAKYNLDVGNIYNSSTTALTAIEKPTGIQNENAKGLSDATNRYGVLPFSNSNYWYINGDYVINENYQQEEKEYPYIYKSNIVNGQQQNSLYSYVNEYQKYLINNGIDVLSSELISTEQLTNLGCSTKDKTCSATSYPWIFGTSYWTGSARGSDVWVVNIYGNFTNYAYDYNRGVGLRPVITMLDDEIGASSNNGSDNGGTTTYLDYNVSNIQAGVILPNQDSSVTLKVKITNIGNAEVGIKNINGLPDNLTYELLDYNLKDKICVDNVCKNGITKEITLKIKYKENGFDSSNTEYNIVVNFDFQEFYTIKYTDIEGSSYLCKRATKLHEEECLDGSCTSTGYKSGDTIEYGQIGDFKNLVSGDALDCDINGDGYYDSETERFYYVSDYYDQSTASYDENIAVLIYYNNIFNELPNNSSEGLISYNLPGTNNIGPVSAAVNLPKFNNISLINPIRQIVNEVGGATTNSIAISTFDYSAYSARLLTVQEVNAGCGITVGNATLGELDKCEYLMENTKYSTTSLLSGYWLETPHSTMSRVWNVFSDYRRISYNSTDVSSVFAVRPVIEVNKSNIDIKGVGSKYQTEIIATDTLKIDFGENALPGLKIKINDSVISNYTYNDGVLIVPNVTGAVEIMDGVKTSTSTDNKVILANVTNSSMDNYKIYGNNETYQVVEYIESTGIQYIDTGIIPNQDTGFDIEFLSKNDLNNTTYGSIMGAREQSVVRELQLTTFSNGNQGTLRYGTNHLNAGLVANTKMHVTLKNKVYNNNNGLTYTVSGTFESPVTLTIFAVNTSASGAIQFGKVQLYSLKLYDGDTLIRDYVPCYRISNGEIGLYDLVEQKFYKNKGSGEFLKGNDVSENILINGVGDKVSTGNNSGKYNLPVVVSGKNVFDKSKSTNLGIQNESETSLWANVVFENNWASTILKPNTTYTISYDIECIDIPEGAEQYQSGATLGFILYKFVNGVDLNSGIYMHTGRFLQEGETIHMVKTFTTPSDILENEYRMYAYGNLYIKDGNYVQTTMRFYNIQIEVGSVETSYESYFETKTNIYLDEPLRCVGDTCDYIDFEKQKVVRYSEKKDGVLTSLSIPSITNIILPNISLIKGYSTFIVGSSTSPSKIEIDYY